MGISHIDFSSSMQTFFGIFNFSFLGIAFIIGFFGLLIFVIYLVIFQKLVPFTTLFKENFGLKLITGSFGAGKTKNVYQSAFLWKKKNPTGILISNIPYDFVDVHFDNERDFHLLMDYLVQYIRDTNIQEELKTNYEFPQIKIVVDEAHTYLFSRDFKGFTKNNLLVLTQVRKREISIDFITQELGQIDVFIRRLCPYVYYYNTLFLGFRVQYLFYSKDSNATDINDEMAFEEVKKIYLFPDSRVVWFNKTIKLFYAQRYLTKWVVGGLEKLNISYTDFKNILHGKVVEFRKPKPLKEPRFKNSQLKGILGIGDNVKQKELEAKDKVIKYLLSKIPEDVKIEINNMVIKEIPEDTKEI